MDKVPSIAAIIIVCMIFYIVVRYSSFIFDMITNFKAMM